MQTDVWNKNSNCESLDFQHDPPKRRYPTTPLYVVTTQRILVWVEELLNRQTWSQDDAHSTVTTVSFHELKKNTSNEDGVYLFIAY